MNQKNHTKSDILVNTLEQMLADCEDNGRDGIQPMFTPDDVKLIIAALRHYGEYCNNVMKVAYQTCGAIMDEPCCADTEGKPLPIMHSEFLASIDGMTSPDYKERFRAEYIQTKVRYERLKAFNNKIEAARRTACDPFFSQGTKKLDEPKHDCPEEMLRDQQSIMGQYLHILEVRAVIEGVDLRG